MTDKMKKNNAIARRAKSDIEFHLGYIAKDLNVLSRALKQIDKWLDDVLEPEEKPASR